MLNDCQLQPTWTCIKFKPLELMPVQSANDRGSIMARPSQDRACTSPSSHRVMVLQTSCLTQLMCGMNNINLSGCCTEAESNLSLNRHLKAFMYDCLGVLDCLTKLGC